MPRRALSDKRPFLLGSIVAALVFYYLRASALPEIYLIPIKGFSAAFLAFYCFARHASADAKLMGWAFGAAALADIAIEFDLYLGGLIFVLFNALAIGVFMRNRREALSGPQSWLVGLVLILTPVIAYFLVVDEGLRWNATLYALSLGGMVSAAWASNFPRYRVGAGAMLVLLSQLVILARIGPLAGVDWPDIMVWPIYYLGQFLICTGVIQTLRKRDPELRLVGYS